MKAKEVISSLRALGSPENVAGMARFGIVTKKAFGVRSADLKEIAKRARKEAEDRHALAAELWATGIHDARIAAVHIDDAKQVTAEQMDAWVRDLDNWAITDSTCGHLFCRSPFAYEKAYEWSGREEEFIKRAGIVMMAWLAVHDKKAEDDKIAALLPLLREMSDDDRNFIKKAVNWSLRQIGKRNLYLNRLAVETAEAIELRGTRPARWIAADALRELKSEAVQLRLAGKKVPG